MASYADAIGPHKSLVIELDDDGNLGEPTGLVERAHEAGLDVHIWTMRDENAFLPANLRIGTEKSDYGDMLPEYLAFLDAGIDGMFSDFTRTAVQAREVWAYGRGSAFGMMIQATT